MIMENSAGSHPPHRSISRYNFDQEISNHWGFPFPLEVGQAVETSSTLAGPTAPLSDGVWGGEVQMPGSRLRFVRTLDFGVLDGLAARAAAEIRETEDALIALIEAEQKRDALHRKTKQEIAAKYNQQDRLGGAA
jgi:hypothetical protein